MPAQKYYTLSGQKHTYHKIKYMHNCCVNEEIIQIYDRFYSSMNPFDPQSTISKVNRNEPVILDSIFIEAFTRSIELAKKTQGAFDPTCAPLINLWGFGYDKQGDVDEGKISSNKEYVGYKKIKLENGLIVKEDLRVQLNFSAIGDGFACEIIARYLDTLEVKNYIVDIGGEMVAKGQNETGKCWSVGILQPPKRLGLENTNKFSTILYLSDRVGLATSGNYNNFRDVNNKLRGHTINVLTGYPEYNNILSATVIASDCIIADALATAIMASEKHNLNMLLESIGLEIDYYIIYLDSTNNYQVMQSRGIKRYMI